MKETTNKTKKHSIDCYHADLCNSQFLQDSFSRDNQLLLVGYIFEGMKVEDLIMSVQESFDNIMPEKIPEDITYEDIKGAIALCFEYFTQPGLDKMLSHVEFPEGDDEEKYCDFDVHFYCYLEWSEVES